MSVYVVLAKVQIQDSHMSVYMVLAKVHIQDSHMSVYMVLTKVHIQDSHMSVYMVLGSNPRPPHVCEYCPRFKSRTATCLCILS